MAQTHRHSSGFSFSPYGGVDPKTSHPGTFQACVTSAWHPFLSKDLESLRIASQASESGGQGAFQGSGPSCDTDD